MKVTMEAMVIIMSRKTKRIESVLCIVAINLLRRIGKQ